MKEILHIQNLKVSYQNKTNTTTILNGVNFSIKEREILCLVGESGCGKSMTAQALMGLLNKKFQIQGNINFAGKNLNQKKNSWKKIRGQKMTMIFQSPFNALNPTMTIGQQISEGLVVHQAYTHKQAKKNALEFLDLVGINEVNRSYNQYPFEFSGGMLQRAMIAMALITNPDILIADEPTTALDVTIQLQILELLQELRDKLGMAILFITHDFSVVAKIADSVAVMKSGEIIESASKKGIIQSPQHTYTKLLLSSLSGILEEKRERQIKKTQEPILSVTNINHVFNPQSKSPVKAVSDINFQLYKGETLGIVGESGCGKSTLAKVIAGLINRTEGEISFLSQKIPQKTTAKYFRQYATSIQMIFQDPYASLNPRMTAFDIIAEPLILQGTKSKQTLQEQINFWLEKVQLPQDCKKRYPHQLSGGQCQRIGIARALILEPKLIICDEILSSLDVSTQTQILDLLIKLKKEANTFIFIAHDLATVASLSDRVAVMKAGKIVEIDETYKIFNSSIHPYTRKLLQASLIPHFLELQKN